MTQEEVWRYEGMSELVGVQDRMEEFEKQWEELVAEAERREERGERVVLSTYSDGSQQGEGAEATGT